MLQIHRSVLFHAATEAGALALRYFQQIQAGNTEELGSAWKTEHPHDVVTHADREGQNIIEHILLEAFPDYGFFAEENGRDVPTPIQEGKRRFVVDPIDGTHNFTKGIKDFSIAIAVQQARNGTWQRLAGMVHLPAHGVSYFAEGGSACAIQGGNETRLTLPRADSPITLAGALVEDSIYSRVQGDFQHAVEHYRSLLVQGQAINHKSYSSAQRLAEIASGSIHALVVGGDFFAWDVEAGFAIAEQAGATHLHQRNFGLDVHIVAATPQLATLLAECWNEGVAHSLALPAAR